MNTAQRQRPLYVERRTGKNKTALHCSEMIGMIKWVQACVVILDDKLSMGIVTAETEAEKRGYIHCTAV